MKLDGSGVAVTAKIEGEEKGRKRGHHGSVENPQD
jgi:hypothetical protein